MAEGAPPVYCWDTCVFSSWLDGDKAREPHIAAYLESARRDEVRIVASVLAIAEVAFVALERASGRKLAPQEEAKIDALWVPPTELHQVVNVYPSIAYQARHLLRYSMEKSLGLKPMDALHLATAQALRATAFHTYDGALEKYSAVIGLKICAPNSADLGALPLSGSAAAPQGAS